jgi:eukaryotic-like serine/threonine-protein kinase
MVFDRRSIDYPEISKIDKFLASPSTSTVMTIQIWKPGDKIKNGRFEVLKELGKGGFGITYLVRDFQKDENVVIKTLNATQQSDKSFADTQENFVKEGFTLKGFDHHHIVKVSEPVQLGSLWGLVMEYIPGEDLCSYMDKNGRLSEGEALGYIDQIAQALDYVHEKKFFHRDVKPENIMLRQGRKEAVLIDFGIAREFIDLETVYLTNDSGTKFYKPIEQYSKRGMFGPYTDVYALAVTMYHLLTGALPGRGSPLYTSMGRKEAQDRGIGEKIEEYLWAELINASVSDRTLFAIQAGMGIKPEDRPKNMTEFRGLLGTTMPMIYEGQITLLSPNPGQAYVHWDVPVKLKRQLRQQGGRKLVIRMYDVTNIDISGQLPINFQEIECDELAWDIHLPLPHADRTYLVEIGYVSEDNNWLRLARSTPDRSIPPKSLLFATSEPTHNSPEPPPPSLIESTSTKSKATKDVQELFVLETIQFTTVKLDNQGKIFARPTETAQIYKESLGNGVILTMVKIPAGSFMMGAPAREKESEINERPQHQVNLKAFYLGQMEVTQAQYQAIMGINPSHFKGAELPVEQVSWLDAKEFCARLSQKAGKFYSLPSESQWEYACRAGTTTPFAFGYTITTDVVNYDGNYAYGKAQKGVHRQKTTIVKEFPPNAFGVLDMHGNVWEWCEDIWHDNYRTTQVEPWLVSSLGVDRSSWSGQNDNNSQEFRVLRGGSWNYIPSNCRSAARRKQPSDHRGITFGFRVACAQEL